LRRPKNAPCPEILDSVITRSHAKPRRHCEEHSDEAIQAPYRGLDCFAFGSQ